MLTASQPFTSALVMSNVKMFKYCWVWNKVKTGNPLNAKKCPLPITEDVCVFYKKPPIYNPLMEKRDKIKRSGTVNKDNIKCFKGLDGKNREYTHKYPTNLLIFSNASQKGKLHPTQKPVALFEYLIKTYSNEGDLVLDSCAGSGTTGVACKNLNRNYILIEKEQAYIDIINKRIQSLPEKLKICPNPNHPHPAIICGLCLGG